MSKACSVILSLCVLVVSFVSESSSVTRTKLSSVDTPLSTKFDEYGLISLAKERRRLDKFARELQRKLSVTTHIVVYGRHQDDVDARIRRIKNYLVKNRGINPYRVITEGQSCRREFKTELWIVPPGAVSFPARANGAKFSPCK
jgi:hypothetical protein